MKSIRLTGIGGAFLMLLAIGTGVQSGATAQTLTQLHPFAGSPNDGASPAAGLIADATGALYGTTYHGGSGQGTVFELTPPIAPDTSWSERVLYSFTGGSDGANPSGNLVADSLGALYGTTQVGGLGYGTVFKLTPPATIGGPWSETLLYTFRGIDGAFPSAGLIFDAAGALYGTTMEGGLYGFGGTIFRLTPTSSGSWTYTVLYNFCSESECSDGAYPRARLVADSSGALYGTTWYGGAGCATTDPHPPGCGTVFRLAPPASGGGIWTEEVLHAFTGGATDGESPFAELILDSSGSLFGTTAYGGPNICQDLGGPAGCGTVFELTPTSGGTWTETVLHAFAGGDGAFPFAGLIRDASGALCGTTESGGAGYGTVFKLAAPSGSSTVWSETVLHSFSAAGVPVDGANPYGGLIADTSGTLYGTTFAGGSNANCGMAFKLTSLAPDTTAPAITFAFNPPPNGNHGWFKIAPASVTVTATDTDGGGVASLRCALDGNDVALLNTSATPTTLSGLASTSADGNHSLACRGTDPAGNSGDGSIQLKLDTAPPTITAAATTSTLWPPNGQLVSDTISGVIADGLSGVDPSTVVFRVLDDYGLIQPTGSVSLDPGGAYSFSVLLEARRQSQTQAGRNYRVIVSAADNAGNHASTSLVITVPHDQR